MRMVRVHHDWINAIQRPSYDRVERHHYTRDKEPTARIRTPRERKSKHRRKHRPTTPPVAALLQLSPISGGVELSLD